MYVSGSDAAYNRSMARTPDILLTALAPMIWGSSYLVIAQFLPPDYPLTACLLRTLPAGLLLLLITRQVPRSFWVWRCLLLGTLNFAAFFSLVFLGAFRLPGGIAATIIATQPLLVPLMARLFTGQRIAVLTIATGCSGMAGVAMITLTDTATLDVVGVFACLAAAVCLSCGTVLTFKWRPPVSAFAFAGWQMLAGGIVMVPVVLVFEPDLPSLTTTNVLGYTYLSVFGGIVAYSLWFRGIASLGPSLAASIGLIAAVTAALLGWVILQQALNGVQLAGMLLVIGSVWVSTRQPVLAKTP